MKRDYRCKGLYLTYDNNVIQDGIGAQIQRIVSVYSISKQLKINYFHTFVKCFDQQVFNQQDAEKQAEDLSRWAEFFDPELKCEDNTNFTISFNLNSIENGTWLRILDWLLKTLRLRVLIRLASPRNFTDKHPDCIKFASEIFNIDFVRPNIGLNSKTELDIAIHFRTGELALAQFQDRYLPLSYFESVLDRIIPRIMEFNFDYKIRIPQENTEKLIPIEDPKIQESIRLYPDNPRVQAVGESMVRILNETPTQNMPHLQSSNWLDSSEPFDDFIQLASADVLILSKSSFSFLAGLANSRSLKIFYPFWHAVPSDWMDGSILNNSSLEKLDTFLMARRRVEF